MLRYETNDVLSGSFLSLFLSLNPSLSLSPSAHRTTLLLYYERDGFDVVLCVCQYPLCSDNRGARRPVIGCLLQTVRLRTDWLLLCECAVHLRWQPHGKVRSQCESAFWRRGEKTTGGAYALFLSAHYGFMRWLNIIQQTKMPTFIVR